MKRTLIGADSAYAFAPSSDHPPSDNGGLSLSFQDLLDAVPVGVFIVDARGCITDCNDIFLDMAGAPRSKVIGFDLINSSRDPSLISHLKEALSGDHAEFETPYTSTTGGKASYYHYVFQPLASPRDDAAVMCFAQDLHKLKVMETTHESLRLSEQKFSQAFRNNPDPMIISAIDTGRIHEVNWGFTQLLGYTAAETIGRTTIEIGLWADATRRDEVAAVMNQKGALSNHEADLVTKDGRTVAVLGSASRLMIEGQPFWLVQFRDVTALKQIEAALRESEERWKFAIEGAGDGLWDWNVQTGAAFYSPRYKEMFGYSDADFDMTSDEWSKRIHPDDAPGVFALLQPYMDGKPGSATVEFRMLCKDGSWKWTLGRGMVVSRDADGKPVRMIGTNADITERKQAEDTIRELAFYDSLTKLPNRHLLNDRLSQAMATCTRSGCYGAVMFLDLDNFKPLNDMHGHAVGDLLLVEVAKRLRNGVRKIDTVSRFGGDEFVVVINGLDEERAESTAQAGFIAEKIRRTLSEPYQLTVKHGGKADTAIEHHCTVSVGVALFAGHKASQEDVLRWADIAMYQAKEAGRSLIRFYDAQT